MNKIGASHTRFIVANRFTVAFTQFIGFALILLATSLANAAPEAHLLRIDPRASSTDGAPVLTTVIEVVQNKRMSDITGPCATLSGDAYYQCVAEKVEQPSALYSSFEFMENNALFTVTVDGADIPAKFESKSRWGSSLNQPGVGTAWLIVLDAASSMGSRFDEAKAVAAAFANSMGPNDIIDVMLINDRAVVQDSKWINNKQQAATFINNAGTYPTQGRTRPLFNIIKTAVTDGFSELGNAGQTLTIPLHQALVVLSNGAAGADPNSTSAGSNLLRQYITKGRFPEDNSALPKTPVPIISVWFPSKQIEEFGANSREFMEGLANTEMGGFFTIVGNGQGGRAGGIVNAVRTRFNKMHIVKWRVACVAPTMAQTFKIAFVNTQTPIAGDATFQNVPVGIDPTTWPIDIDRDATEREAKKNPIYPGGTVKIFGNFCWGGNQQRAEIYMVPKNQAVPAQLTGGSIEDAKKAQQTLIKADMRGKSITAGDSVVEFELPNNEKFLVGSGEQMNARMVIYDNAARRTSPVTADKILTLKAREKPFPFLMIGGITFGAVVILLLVVSIFRGGGNKRAAAPAPVAAGPRPIVAGGAPAGYAPAPIAYNPGAPVGPSVSYVNKATLTGQSGIFTVTPGIEMRAGRDGAVCQILLAEARVSGAHASVKVENGQFLVRDDNSNNGTYLQGQRLQPGMWTPVSQGASLRFGPVDFSVTLE